MIWVLHSQTVKAPSSLAIDNIRNFSGSGGSALGICAAWDDRLKSADSVTFVAQAQAFASVNLDGKVHGSQWLGEAPYIMPLFRWLTALPFILAGKAGAIVYILIQGALDSDTCVLVYLIACSLDTRLALPSAIAAIPNPTQIVMSAMIYANTPFTFFVMCVNDDFRSFCMLSLRGKRRRS